MANPKCLVTLAIGDAFKRWWGTYARASWAAYAGRHGYDIVVIEDYIDDGARGRARSPHWQKCLILEHPRVAQYKSAVWVDADILINPHTAPCIVAATAAGRIGAVTHSSKHFNEEKLANIQDRQAGLLPQAWVRENPRMPARELYGRAGLGNDIDDWINTGVLALQPKTHAPVLRQVYERYAENEYTAKEMMPLSYHLLKQGLVHALDTRFNKLWDEILVEHYPFLLAPEVRRDHRLVALCVNAAYHNSFFLHFLHGVRGFASEVAADRPYAEAWRYIEANYPPAG